MRNKRDIRNEALESRKGLEKEAVARFSGEICENLLALDEYAAASDICLYCPIGNEVDVMLLVNAARGDGKRLWLPKVRDGVMDFYVYDEDTVLTKGTFGIREPGSDTSLVPSKDTLVVMPGAAFSETRDRIGYGGGYYDRFLAKNPCCVTAAVCYDFQIFPVLPSEAHDIKPDIIVSEDRVIRR